MSKGYLISACLSNKFTSGTCKKIIQKGQSLQLLYPRIDFYKTTFKEPLLSIDESIKVVIEGDRYNDTHILYFKLFDNYSELIFSGISGPSFSVSINPGNWKQVFYTLDEHTYTDKFSFIDNARYARLLLSLLEDLDVKNFEISKIFEEQLHNLDKHCLTAMIINEDDSSERIVKNIYLNKSHILSCLQNRKKLSWETAFEYVDAKFPFKEPVELYIETSDTISKLIITENIIKLYPMDPACKKFVNNKFVRDTSFYIRFLLDICEEYPILEFKTTFEECC